MEEPTQRERLEFLIEQLTMANDALQKLLTAEYKTLNLVFTGFMWDKVQAAAIEVNQFQGMAISMREVYDE